MIQERSTISRIGLRSIELIMLVASAVFIGGCIQEEVPKTAPTSIEVAQGNFYAYVRLMYSGEKWDIANSCLIDEMVVGKAKCYANERGTIDGRELYARVFIFACETVPGGKCEPYVEPEETS